MSETLTIPPAVVETTYTRRCVRTFPGSGKSGATAVVERKLRSWKLSWTDHPASYLVELRRMINATFGPVVPFTWTPPGGSSMLVRVMGPIVSYFRPGAASMTMELEIEELR